MIKYRPIISSYQLSDFMAVAWNTLKRKLWTGKSIKYFCNIFSKYIGVQHSVFVPSARVGLEWTLECLNLGKDSEVIFPAYTYSKIPEMVSNMGLKPVFVDISLDDRNIDTTQIEVAITGKTKAIIATHILGTPCDMDTIMDIAKKYQLIVIEDCAHSLGANYRGKKTGAIGDISYFSFGKEKNIECISGGIICTKDEELKEYLDSKMRLLQYQNIFQITKNISIAFLEYCRNNMIINHGLRFTLDSINYRLIRKIKDKKNKQCNSSQPTTRYYYYRPNNFQGMIGIRQLKRLEIRQDKRIENSRILSSLLDKDYNPIQTSQHNQSVYLRYEIIAQDKEQLKKRLRNVGIMTEDAYMCDCSAGKCRNAALVDDKGLIIPNSEIYNQKDMKIIARHING